MNVNDLDLDINNYSLKDIERFFRLKPNYKYTESDIELKEYELREQLLQSGHIDKTFKRDLIEFLNSAKDWLIFVKCKKEAEPQHIAKNKAHHHQPPPPERGDNEIVKRSETPFVYSNNSEYFQGKLNPLNTRTITKCLNIDTRFRDNLFKTQSSDFVIQLPMKFNKVVSMQLASFEIPISFYGISEAYGNNHFYLQVEHTSCHDDSIILKDDKTVIVPDGNYSANDLIDTINNILCPRDDCHEMHHPDSIFSYIKFELDINAGGSGTGKVKIKPFGKNASHVNWIIMDFSKDINGNNSFANVIKKIGWNLGFMKSYYFGLCEYTSEAIMEPSTTRYLYLGVEDFNNHSNDHFVSVMKDNFMSKDILARISLKGSNFSILMENNMNIVSEPRTYFGPVDIQKLRIRLYDEFGNILQMNNSNYSFCLNLKLLYDL